MIRGICCQSSFSASEHCTRRPLTSASRSAADVRAWVEVRSARDSSPAPLREQKADRLIGHWLEQTDSVDTGSRRQDSVDTGSRRQDSMDTGSRRQDSVDTGSSRQDSVDTGSSRQDSVDTGLRRQDSVDTGSSRQDSVDTGSSRQDSVDTGSSRQTHWTVGLLDTGILHPGV